MPIQLACDGCERTIDPEDAKKVGRLDGACCYYCAKCAAIYDKADGEIEKLRVRLSKQFEAERRRVLAAARKKLTRLPDE